MQFSDVNWTVFGWSLVGAFLFGVFYAILVRLASKRKWVGQTAWSVVVGVTFTLVAMLPVFGLFLVALVLCFFAASGTPMVIEYLTRIQAEMQQDFTQAREVNKELLNDRKAPDR